MIDAPGLPKELLDDFRAKRTLRDTLKAQLEEAEADYDAVEEILWDKMLELDLKNMRIDGLGTCSRTVKGPYPSLDHQNDPQAEQHFTEWCRDEGIYESIFKFQPSMQSLIPIIKDMRAKGLALPPGVRVAEYKRIQVLKK
jgi:hypothetical protein